MSSGNSSSPHARTALPPTTIAFVIDFLASRDGLTGGTERQLIDTINRMDTARFRMLLFCLREYVPIPQWESLACDKHVLHVYSFKSLRAVGALVHMAKRLRRHNVKVLQTFFFDGAVLGTLAAKLAGVPVILSSRRDLGFSYDERLLRRLRLVNRFVTKFLVNSQAIKETVAAREHVDPERIDVVHNGIDVEAIERTPGARPRVPGMRAESRIVGFVGNFNRPVKRADLFVRAAAEIGRVHPDVQFVLIGGGALENELKRLADELGIADRVFFLGPSSTPVPLMKSFDVGVQTSDSEGFSNVLLEYMAARVPVVATAVGGNRELLQDGSTGFLVPPGCHLAVAGAVSRILSDSGLSSRFRERAYRVVAERYAWPRVIKELEAYYQRHSASTRGKP